MPDDPVIPSPEEIIALRDRVHRATMHEKVMGSTAEIAVPLYQIRYLLGLIDAFREAPLTQEQAEAELATQADAPPLPEERIKAIVAHVMDRNELLQSNERLRSINADLIAACEFLVAEHAKVILNYFAAGQSDRCYCSLCDEARAALAKAKGESQ